ncbi:DUF2809 domain-containing protein [Aquimarina sp. MAR_2010_214]|uniref:ribosomal maturation YjgA family protein n=1 Tax=Aquimarina sp. MAR_2010_214 TaxID=1250026 RepID=UPI001E2C9400|nr:DUF2809 domain-containing protein [Aquimarina sp. MAR_2010_214]
MIEILIALFVDDKIIRPYLGDTIVVILIYCFFRSFLKGKARLIAIGTLLFSYTIEILQYFNFVEVLGLGHYKLARIILGNSFSWLDMLSYTFGFIIVVWLDKIQLNKREVKVS